MTPFFKGRDADKDSEREKIREIFDIKPYSPFEEKNKYRDARPTRDNSYRRRLEHVSFILNSENDLMQT